MKCRQAAEERGDQGAHGHEGLDAGGRQQAEERQAEAHGLARPGRPPAEELREGGLHGQHAAGHDDGLRHQQVDGHDEAQEGAGGLKQADRRDQFNFV